MAQLRGRQGMTARPWTWHQSIGLVSIGLLVFLTVGPSSGCQTTAPIHVWQDAKIANLTGSRVGIAQIEGPVETANKIRSSLLSSASGDDPTRQVVLVDPLESESAAEIRLVSATDSANDLAVASVAGGGDWQYILRGELLPDLATAVAPGGPPPADPHRALRMTWRLISVAENRSLGGHAVLVPPAERTIFTATSPEATADAQVQQATAKTLELIRPSVIRTTVRLEKPFGIPGARATRAGNEMAEVGNWSQANTIWSKTLQAHPGMTAAKHNLAIAAAAAQDFSTAKKLIREVVKKSDSDLHRQTMAWIETQQRIYVTAFGLPEPDEGWFITRTPDSKSSRN